MERSISNIPGSSFSVRSETALLMLVVFGTALLVRLACFTGLIASDDLGYSGFALRIAQGTYELEPHHYAIRYGLLLPVAAFYRLFGATEWSSVVVSLLANSMACVVAAIIARRYAGMAAAWIVGILMATFPIDVRYSTTLVPETVAALPMLGGALLFLQARDRASLARGVAAGVCFGIGYLTKEPVAFVAVAFFLFALIHRRWDLAVQLSLGAGVVVAGELVWYWSQTQDLLFRPHAMAVHNSSEAAVEANSQLSWRLWKAYPRMMIVPNVHFGIHSIFALVLAAITIVRLRVRGDVLLLALWAAVPYLYLNFGSSSFTHYWALPLAPRYISLIYPPLFILAAMTLVHWWSRKRQLRWAAIATVAVVSVSGVAAARTTKATGYGTQTVVRLKSIASTARAQKRQVCVTPADSASWGQILGLLEANLGCGDRAAIRLQMDSLGRPATATSAGSPAPPSGANSTSLIRS